MTNVPSHGYAGLYAREGLYASKPPDFAGVYAESRDLRITSHAEPGSLVRLRCTADKLPIKTLEFRDSEKSASKPPTGVYSPNAISTILSHENPGVHPPAGSSGTKSQDRYTSCPFLRHEPRRASQSLSSANSIIVSISHVFVPSLRDVETRI